MSVDNSFRFAVAPMMDWTDRHCRVFHRLMSRRALLYTEMISASALVRGHAVWLLDHDQSDHPVALQLGGSDPGELAEATRMGVDRGYDEINLNAGCPSDRVQEGCFGAILMKRPGLVARCLKAMIDAADKTEVTVKCRIGVDEQIAENSLPEFLEVIAGAGVRRVAIHARKAWLSGLSPKQNRTVPPLDHELVLAMKERFPQLLICLNGGITDLDMAEKFLERGVDGIMMGRSAYRSPVENLLAVDRRIFGEPGTTGRRQIAEGMLEYIALEQARGVGIHQITRHMNGLYSGCRGARAWRQSLSDSKTIANEGIRFLAEVIERQGTLEPVAGH